MSYAESDHPALLGRGVFDRIDGVLVVARPNDQRRATIEREARKSGAAISVFVPTAADPDDEAAASQADFYVMVQAAAGLTGPRTSLDLANAGRIARLRASGVTARSFSALASRMASRRAVPSVSALTASSLARPRCAALGGRAELAALLRDLRIGLDG